MNGNGREKGKLITATDLLKYYVEPHSKVSRECTVKDVERIKELSGIMLALCKTPIGNYRDAYAIAHPQIDKDDPLRFFVLNSGQVIVNPVITNHTRTPIISEEGCMSYPLREKVRVERYNIITVNYQIIVDDKFELIEQERINGITARVFQHEIQHMDGENIYNEK